jgi:hypothetical protein
MEQYNFAEEKRKYIKSLFTELFANTTSRSVLEDKIYDHLIDLLQHYIDEEVKRTLLLTIQDIEKEVQKTNIIEEV